MSLSLRVHAVRRILTANVSLADDSAHRGGRLLALFDRAVHTIERSEGEATVHPGSLLHGVSRMQEGVRYSLIIFYGTKEGCLQPPALTQFQTYSGPNDEHDDEHVH